MTKKIIKYKVSGETVLFTYRFKDAVFDKLVSIEAVIRFGLLINHPFTDDSLNGIIQDSEVKDMGIFLKYLEHQEKKHSSAKICCN